MPERAADVMTAVEMAVLEQNAVALGISIDALMENAGRAIAEEASHHLPSAPARVAFVAGSGNNGGDGTCAAFYLGQWGYTPEIWMVRPPSEIRSVAARRCFERIERRYPVRFHAPKPHELADIPLVIDALLGTGQTGRPQGGYGEAVIAINAAGAPVLSIDVPSGLGSDLSVRPRWTVALTSLKPGMSDATCGTITVRDIGIPEAARRRSGPGDFLFFPVERNRGPRGRSGRVVVIGGGPYAGAPGLAALAALRAGAERATVLAPRPAADQVQGFSPNLVVRSVGEEAFRPDDVPRLVELVKGSSVQAIVVGMGVGSDPSTLDALRQLLREIVAHAPLVVDAEALAALPPSRDAPSAAGAAIVGTPNVGEYLRDFEGGTEGSWEDRLEAARQRARARGMTLLVKGEADLVTDGTRAVMSPPHPRALAVAGAGDVLAGVVGALLAQGLAPFASARLASYWVGEAGSRVAARRGFGLVATDLLEELPATLVDGLARVRRPYD
ncbi:MAG: NAD(P)H-hydrate dehydratase [Thermoplasmata archaeon]